MDNKKGFTLLELLISIGIIAILFVILFRAYTTISEVTFRVQQEKNIQQELIRVAQTLQNIADNHTIDFDKYSAQTNQSETENISKTIMQSNKSLFLSGQMGRIEITNEGICRSNIPEITGFTQEERDNPCKLIIKTEKKTINITTPTESFISQPFFSIFPSKKNKEIIDSEKIPFMYIRQASFQIRFSLYTPRYQKGNRINMSSTLFQQFFNLQK